MPEVTILFQCRKCGEEFENQTGDFECPKCGGYGRIVERIIVCEDCGKTVDLVDALTNECDCGALYNGFGQRLAPRSEWGEDDPIYDGEY